MKYILCAIIFLSFSCNSHRDHTKTTEVVNVPSIHKARGLDIDSIRINGSIKFLDSYKKVKSYLGEPDSIKTSKLEVFYRKGIVDCYFNGITFMQHGRDTAVFDSINFKKSPTGFIQSPQMKFDSSTKIEDVRRMFECEDMKRGTDMDVRITLFISVFKKGKESELDSWILDFDTKTGKLYRFSYARPPEEG